MPRTRAVGLFPSEVGPVCDLADVGGPDDRASWRMISPLSPCSGCIVEFNHATADLTVCRANHRVDGLLAGAVPQRREFWRGRETGHPVVGGGRRRRPTATVSFCRGACFSAGTEFPVTYWILTWRSTESWMTSSSESIPWRSKVTEAVWSVLVRLEGSTWPACIHRRWRRGVLRRLDGWPARSS